MGRTWRSDHRSSWCCFVACLVRALRLGGDWKAASEVPISVSSSSSRYRLTTPGGIPLLLSSSLSYSPWLLLRSSVALLGDAKLNLVVPVVETGDGVTVFDCIRTIWFERVLVRLRLVVVVDTFVCVETDRSDFEMRFARLLVVEDEVDSLPLRVRRRPMLRDDLVWAVWFFVFDLRFNDDVVPSSVELPMLFVPSSTLSASSSSSREDLRLLLVSMMLHSMSVCYISVFLFAVRQQTDSLSMIRWYLDRQSKWLWSESIRKGAGTWRKLIWKMMIAGKVDQVHWTGIEKLPET